MAVHIGTSGWHYADWKGTVYPNEIPKTRWFEHYTTLFDTVEINASFYRLPTEKAVANWGGQAPRGFIYAAKGSRFTTHNLKIGGDRLPQSVELVTGRLKPLRDHMPVMLWQLPPNLHQDVDRLARFAGLLPDWVRHAVEFRHPSWHDDSVTEVLSDHQVARVWVSAAGSTQPTPVTAGLVYLRLHGLGEDPYRWDYSDDDLQPWVRRIDAAVADGHDAFVYFNNDFHGHAVRNAQRFSKLLGST